MAARNEMHSRRPIAPLLPAIFICAAVVAAFLPALDAEFVIWDDDLNLTNNPDYRGFTARHLRWMFTTTLGGHYQPLTWLSYAVDHALYGMAPAGYHATNLLLHAANAILVWVILRRLLRPLGIASDAALSYAAPLGALAFAIHPLRVESVVWVTERRDVLAGFFWLVALLSYLRAVDADGGTRRRRLAASLVALALSLLAKAWGITFPLLLLILDAYPLRRLQRDTAQVIREKIPFAVVAAAGAAASFVAQQSAGMSALGQHALGSRVAQAAYGLCFYVAKTAWPTHLQPLYLLEFDFDPMRPRYLIAKVVVVAITLTALVNRRRRPWLLAAWASYFVILAPVLGFAQTGPQLVADRYSYLATLPLTALLAAGLARAIQLHDAIKPRWIALAVVAGLGVLTFRQSTIWHDSMRLWDHALAIDPGNYIAYNNRGRARGVSEGAVEDYSAAIRLNPGDYIPYFNRATIRDKLGDKQGAMSDYNAALNLAGGDPNIFNNRGWLREQYRDWNGAIADYTRARDLAPPGSALRALAEKNIEAVEAQMIAAEQQ